MQNKTSASKARKVADRAMAKTARCVEQGLPVVYANFDAYMVDFYPDLPWDLSGLRAAVRHILQEHQATLAAVQERFQYDMKASLEEALRIV